MTSLVTYPNHFGGNTTYVFQLNGIKICVNGCQMFSSDDAERVFDKFDVPDDDCQDVLAAFSQLDEEVDPVEIAGIHEDLYREVVNPTYEFKMETVTKIGINLCWIEDPTPELCLAAVKSNGHAIRDVVNPTEEMCVAAVTECAFALAKVQFSKRTAAVVDAALARSGEVLQWVPNPTKEQMLSAVTTTGTAIRHIPHMTPELCLAAVKSNGLALQHIPRNLRSAEIKLAAVTNNPRALTFISHSQQDIDLCRVALVADPRSEMHMCPEIYAKLEAEATSGGA